MLMRAMTHGRPSRSRGFTLIELLVVMVIIGVTLGLVSLNAMPNGQQALQKEAERIALLLQLARDEAIVRSRQVAFEADENQYRFLVLNEKLWQPVTQDDLLRERAFANTPMLLSVQPAATPLSADQQLARLQQALPQAEVSQ